MKAKERKEKDAEYEKLAFIYDLLIMLSETFSAYVQFFLLYLDYKFTKQKNKEIKDPLLNRDVSFVVFIKNQQAYIKAAQEPIENRTKEKLRELAAKALE